MFTNSRRHGGGSIEGRELPRVPWEPACGLGAIARVLRRHGHVVYATDLVDYDSPDQDESGWDFLLERQLPRRAAPTGRRRGSPDRAE